MESEFSCIHQILSAKLAALSMNKASRQSSWAIVEQTPGPKTYSRSHSQVKAGLDSLEYFRFWTGTTARFGSASGRLTYPTAHYTTKATHRLANAITHSLTRDLKSVRLMNIDRLMNLLMGVLKG